MPATESVMGVSSGEKFRHALEELMQEREEVLVSFCSLLSIDAQTLEPYREHLCKLAQLLTDYSALGHFEVIDPIVSSKGLGGADDIKLIAAIQDTTDDILGFTDHYSASCQETHSVSELAEALNSLGERLAERFELEDSLFQRLGD